MERLNAAVADAIARAMTGDEEELVGEEGKERLIAKATADPSFVHSSVQAAMSDPQLLAILRAENLADEILLDAASSRNARLVSSALSMGADINVRHPATGDTPLILAAMKQSYDCVSLLLRWGGPEGRPGFRGTLDVDAVGETGTALVAAADAGHEELCVLLLDAGANPHARYPLEHDTESKRGKDMFGLIRAEHYDALASVGLAHYVIEVQRRKEVLARVRSYVTGTLRCSDALPPCYHPANRPWTELSHRYSPPALREAVMSLLCASRRRTEGEPCCLPPELWRAVFRHMDRGWIREPDGGTGASVATAAATAARGASSIDTPPSGQGQRSIADEMCTHTQPVLTQADAAWLKERRVALEAEAHALRAEIAAMRIQSADALAQTSATPAEDGTQDEAGGGSGSARNDSPTSID